MRRRLGGVVSAAVVPLAAAVAVWSPLGNAFPAEATRAPQAEVARPATLRTTAGQCVWELQRADPYSVLAGGEGSLATSALYRFADGETHFCVAFAAGSVDNRVEVDSLGRQVLWGWVKNQDGSFDASLFGPRKAGYARVVVSTPDGQQYQAIFLDRYWWTPVHVADQSLLDDSRWTAYDRYGRLVGQGRVSTDY